MVEKNCAGTQPNTTVYPTTGCPECPPNTTITIVDYTPQACIKIYNDVLFSCSTNILPEGCSKIVKIYDLDMEILFTGTYAEANAFILTQQVGNYFAKEIISCLDTQTESNDLCFELYTVIGPGDIKQLKPSCKCCEKPEPVAYDTEIIIDCNKCGIIDFQPLLESSGNLDTVNISETNPVTNGILTNIPETNNLYKFCPTNGYNGTTSFGFTITDTDGNTTEEKTVIIEVRNNCPTDPIECEDTTVTVGFADIVDDVPLTDFDYPINVLSPFSNESGTFGNLGTAANYAGIIALLNGDANKPAGITYIANVNTTKIDVNGTCNFNPIKLGDSVRLYVAQLEERIIVLESTTSNQQVQLDYIMTHLFDCCETPPGLDVDFSESKIDMCFQDPILGKLYGQLTISASGTDFDVLDGTTMATIYISDATGPNYTKVVGYIPKKMGATVVFDIPLLAGMKDPINTPVGLNTRTISFTTRFLDTSSNVHIATITANIPTLNHAQCINEIATTFVIDEF